MKYLYVEIPRIPTRTSSKTKRQKKQNKHFSRSVRGGGGNGERPLNRFSGITKSFDRINEVIHDPTPDIISAKTEHDEYADDFPFKFIRNDDVYGTETLGGFNAVFILEETPLNWNVNKYVLRVSNASYTGGDMIKEIDSLRKEYEYQQMASVSQLRNFNLLHYGDDNVVNIVEYNRKTTLALPIYAIGVFLKDEEGVFEKPPLERQYHLYSVIHKMDAEISVVVIEFVETKNEHTREKLLTLIQIALAKANQVGDMFIMCDMKCGNVLVDKTRTDAFLIDFGSENILDENSIGLKSNNITKKEAGYYNELLLLFGLFEEYILACRINFSSKFKPETTTTSLYRFLLGRIKTIYYDRNFDVVFKKIMKIRTARETFENYYPDGIDQYMDTIKPRINFDDVWPGGISPNDRTSMVKLREIDNEDDLPEVPKKPVFKPKKN